jgi:hypothetical protein
MGLRMLNFIAVVNMLKFRRTTLQVKRLCPAPVAVCSIVWSVIVMIMFLFEASTWIILTWYLSHANGLGKPIILHF